MKRILGRSGIEISAVGMGVLTGKFSPDTIFSSDDVRSWASEWFPGLSGSGVNPEWLTMLDQLREILTSDGRTLGQGALAWIWAASPMTVPIPGFKTSEQVKENAGAMDFGPLTEEQMGNIDILLGRGPTIR